MRNLKFLLRNFIGNRLSIGTIRGFLAAKTEPKIIRIYGEFKSSVDFDGSAIKMPKNESGVVRGELVHLLDSISGKINSLLLPGEPLSSKSTFARLASITEAKIVTAGLHNDADHQWNFENDHPDELNTKRFDCIVSQAILEHLIDPYKHVRDNAALLEPNGYLLIHTVMPGFIYHRHPVDCMRFYPDWFEEVAKRLSLTVVDRIMGDGHIVYMFQRTN